MKNNQMMSKAVVLLLMVFSLGGCVSLSQVESARLGDSLPERPVELEPITDAEGKTARVVLQIKNPLNPERSTKQNLLKRLQQNFERELGKLPDMVVDRSLGKSVGSEIELSEIYGKDSGRQDTDYVMLIAIDEYTSSQTSEQKEAMFSDKKYTACNIQLEYKGWIRVLTIPALKKTHQWSFEEENSKSYDRDNAGQCRASFTKQRQALQSKMLNNTVCSSKTDYLNALSPTGHVLSIKRDKDAILLETSLGSTLNVNEGDSVHLYHELEFEYFAEGVVTSITPKSAWVKLNTLNKNEAVYLYDWVRPHYPGLMNSLKCLF